MKLFTMRSRFLQYYVRLSSTPWMPLQNWWLCICLQVLIMFFILCCHCFPDGPVFTKKPNAVDAYENTNARFECRADGIPKPNITWTKNGEELVNKAFISITDGYLTVNDLVPSDKGVYQCFAKNYLGKIQASAQLSVYREGNNFM